MKKLKCGARVHTNCYGELPADQMIRLEWRKQGRHVDVCPNCFQYIKDWEIKNLSVSLEQLVKSGLYDKGVREVDIKSMLEKWTKKVKDSQ